MIKKIVVAGVILFTTPSFAGMTVKFIGHGLGTTGGGELLFETYGIPGYSDSSILTTFCVEKYEWIFPCLCLPCYDADIITEAISGCFNYGPLGPKGGDPLDPMTAYLFYHYTKGDLVGWQGDDKSADALQRVIWGIEDEMGKFWTPTGTLEKTFYNEAYNAVYGPDPTWQGLGNVRVLNLYTFGYNENCKCCWPYWQDQLVIIIPSPDAIILGWIGVSLVGWLRRRRIV